MFYCPRVDRVLSVNVLSVSLLLFSLYVPLAVRPVAADVPGVVGDGVADESDAIQAAIDSGIGRLEFRRGTYRLTRTIEIDLDRVGWTSVSGGGVARFRMDGPGPAFRFVGTHEGTAAPDSVKPAVWDRQRTPMVDGIEIIGGHADACGIEAEGTMQLTLTRLIIRKVHHAVRLVKRNRNVTLSECHFYENRGIGVFLDTLNLHQINIANCHISYNAGGGVVSRNSEIRNLQIGTCDIEGNMGGESSQPTANVLLDSTDSSIGEVAIVGCTIQHTHDAPGSANIRINGNSTPRPFTDESRHGNVTIADNILSDVQTNIELRHVRGITISGNTMWKGYTSNLSAVDCAHVVLTGNLYDRNPRYHYGDGSSARLGMMLENCSDVTLTGEHFGGDVAGHPAVVQLIRCDGVNMTGCTFATVSGAALLIDEVTFGSFSNCLVTGVSATATPILRRGSNDVEESGNRYRTRAAAGAN